MCQVGPSISGEASTHSDCSNHILKTFLGQMSNIGCMIEQLVFSGSPMYVFYHLEPSNNYYNNACNNIYHNYDKHNHNDNYDHNDLNNDIGAGWVLVTFAGLIMTVKAIVHLCQTLILLDG